LTWGGGTPELPQRLFPRWFQGLAPTLGQTGLEAQWTPQTLEAIHKPLRCPSCPPKYRWGPVTYAVNTFRAGWPIVRLQQISRPSSTIYLADGYAAFWSSSDMVDAGWPPPTIPPSVDKSIYFPHRGKCNALFVDGHVKQFSNSIPAANFQLSP
jgi:prepilin-type processing-associated H-X9-DG protein